MENEEISRNGRQKQGETGGRSSRKNLKEKKKRERGEEEEGERERERVRVCIYVCVCRSVKIKEPRRVCQSGCRDTVRNVGEKH